MLDRRGGDDFRSQFHGVGRSRSDIAKLERMDLAGRVRIQGGIERIDTRPIIRIDEIDPVDTDDARPSPQARLGCRCIRVRVGHCGLARRRARNERPLRTVTGGFPGLRQRDPVLRIVSEVKPVLGGVRGCPFGGLQQVENTPADRRKAPGPDPRSRRTRGRYRCSRSAASCSRPRCGPEHRARGGHPSGRCRFGGPGIARRTSRPAGTRR